MTEESKSPWTIEHSLEYYNILNWGGGYFGINNAGHLCVWPFGQPGPSIDMMDVIDEIHSKNLTLPCLVRFQDILRSRVIKLNESFQKHIRESGYKGKYYGVYPIKVNQMREVVEEILDAGEEFNIGMEAGSKAELLPVLAYNSNVEAVTICNGYKDEEFIRLALVGRKLGRKVFIVIEKISELPHVLKIAEEMSVEPLIGLRARLATAGTGKWNCSSGDYAKFGLTTPEIIKAVELLKKENKQHCLKLFHFHAGSQLTDIRTIMEAVNEGCRIYAKLVKMGMPIEYFDVGGGLGIDYEGAKTTSYSSKNYTLDEYVADIVYGVQEICRDEKVAEPHLISESGRALTAHHSCILMNVFGNIQVGLNDAVLLADSTDSSIVRRMKEIVSALSSKNLQEIYHDATEKKTEALTKFKLGILDLEERAKIEALYWYLLRRISEHTKKLDDIVPEDIRNLDEVMADQYLANFSVFQSAPDHWAFEQLFPVVPIHRLDEEPTRQSTVVDITCDSDGKIDRFIDMVKPKPSELLHPLNPGEPYFLGMFLLGAYQDVMGDMHNLFGRLHEVHVFCDDEDPEDFYIEEDIPGATVEEVLAQHQYFPNDLIKVLKKTVEAKIKTGELKPKEAMMLSDLFEKSLKSYTYLKTNSNAV